MPSTKLIPELGFSRYAALVLSFVWNRLQYLFWTTETKSAEITFGLIAIGWWAVITHTHAFSGAHLLDYLATVAPLPLWAAVMLALGAGQLLIAFSFDQVDARKVRAAVWLIATTVWSQVAWASILVVPSKTAAVVYTTMALGSAWGFLRSLER